MIELAKCDDCTGCQACGDACPIGAIKFLEDGWGFWHPSINSATCTECGKCRAACPVLKESLAGIQKEMPLAVCSAYSKEIPVREASTSGGLFYELAASALSEGCAVCACRYSEDYRSCFHAFAANMEELEPLLGSKYFQSDMAGVYKKAESLLKAGQKVLFSGAPCQCAALQQYLPQSLRESLTTVEFICRGINSPKGYVKFIEELEGKYGARASNVRFKDKSRGWTNLGMKIRFENGREYYGNRHNDAWINSFIVGNFIIRPSCGTCHFKGLPRVSDLMIGDFWGSEYTAEERKYGVSVVAANSKKGLALLDAATPRLVRKDAPLEKMLKGNGMIEQSVKLEREVQDEFFRRLESEKFSRIV